MKLLLDTHIWIWSALEPSRLRGHVIKELRDASNEIWLSPISVWELAMLVEKKRLSLQDGTSARRWTEEFLRAAPIHEAALTFDIAAETGRFSYMHGDPADRFIAATALVLDLTLVTADAGLKRARGVKVLMN